MNAIRVMKRGNVKLQTVHLLGDPERTLCGLKPADLDVIEVVEVDTLPALNGCRACARVSDGWVKEASPVAGRITSESQPGRWRTTGPLRHGTRITRGNRIGGGR